MNLSIILLAVVGSLVPASPAPTPGSGLPEIGHVRSNALCSTLRANIAPTVLGLMKNDEIIGAGHRAFLKMAHDAGGTSGASIEIDKLYLEQVETRLVHNLKVVDKLLGDQQRFPAQPRTDDERDAASMKAQLVAVADAQRKALDLVSGTLETESLGQMQHDINTQMTSATGPQAPLPAATSDPVSFMGSAGLPEYTPVSGLPTTASKTSSVGGHTVYDSIASALETTQLMTARREAAATSSVVAAVNDCHATPPEPTPTLRP